MKTWCDVCERKEASVFCSADEAALCRGCDRKVHHANKVASKHTRFSILAPQSPKDSAPCDICQERRALFFCHEDRAILCRDCDISIHRTNPFRQNHSRFLITNLQLSSAPPDHSILTAEADTRSSSPGSAPCELGSRALFSATDHTNWSHNNAVPVATASWSEYFTEDIPAWQVQDFLLDHFPYGSNGSYNNVCS